MKKQILVIAALMCSTTFAGAQFINYTQADGLIYHVVKSIAVDSNGNKWTGTGNGVSEFNEVMNTWTNYNTYNSGLSANGITSVTIDKMQNKWFGTSNPGYGLDKLDAADSLWTNYNKSNNGLVYDNVFAVAEDSHNNKWIGTGHGISKFDGTVFKTINTADNVKSIFIDKSDNKWFATSSGVLKYDSVFTRYSATDYGLINDTVNSILIEDDSILWAATIAGISKFDIKGNKWTLYNDSTTSGGLISNMVTSVAVDPYGNKWFGTDKGISEFVNDSLWISYTTGNSGLNDNYIYCITVDTTYKASGWGWLMWFGTKSGVSRFGPCSIPESNTENPVFIVYPCPATDKITLEISSFKKDFNVSVYNIHGQLLLQQTMKSLKSVIDISGLSQGLYLLKAENEERVAVERFVKE